MDISKLSIRELKVVFVKLGGHPRKISGDKRVKSVWIEAVEALLCGVNPTQTQTPVKTSPTHTNAKEEICVSKAGAKRILLQKINAKTITIKRFDAVNKSVVLVVGKIDRKTFARFVSLESFINDFKKLREEGAKDVQLTILDICNTEGEIKASALAQSVSREIQHKTTLSECSCEDFSYHKDLPGFQCKHIIALEYACQDVLTHSRMLHEQEPIPEWVTLKEELLYQ